MAPESLDFYGLRLKDAGVVTDFPDAETLICDGAGIEIFFDPYSFHDLHPVRCGVVEEFNAGHDIHHGDAASAFQGIFCDGEKKVMAGGGGVVESLAPADAPGLPGPGQVHDVRRGFLLPADVRLVFAPVEPVGEAAVFQPCGA